MKKATNMMYLKTVSLLILALSINSTSYSITPSGVDKYPKSRLSLNVEAVHSASPAEDPAAILESQSSKRLILKVTDTEQSLEKLPYQTGGKLTNIQLINLNTDTISQVMFITGFLETALSSGDAITVDYSKPDGTQIRINGVTVINTESSQLFDHLFNDWLDNSRAANQNHAPSHATIFNYNQNQTQLVTNWVSARESVKASQYNQALQTAYTPSVKKEVIAIAQPKTQVKAMSIDERISSLEKRRLAMEERRLAAEERRLEAAEKRLAAAEKRLEAEEQRLIAEERKLFSRERTASLAGTSTLTNNTALFAPADNRAQSEPKQSPPQAEKKIVKNQKRLKSVVSTTKNPAFIKLENQYYLDLYKWELTTEIYRLVKYPAWAKSLGKKGNVKLNFTVDRQTRVSKVNGDNPKISIQLISELHRAIMTAAKLVLPPDALPGNSWDMSIAYNFQPNGIEQVAIDKPSRPLFLEREENVVLISSDNNLTKYQEEIKDIISDRIEYPVWAEKLNQKGNVSFEIVINKDGSIADIVPKEVNRHLFLNQEVLKAINESSPLPSIPEHLRLQSTNMIIQHDFKKNK